MEHTKFHYGSLEDIHGEAEKVGVALPLSEQTDILFHPLDGPVSLENRFAIQPMEGCDAAPDGSPGELTLRRYERFARSGAGLIWGEAADSIRCFVKLGNIDWREYPQPEIPTAGKL